MYVDQGKYWEAEPLMKRAKEICEKQLGMNHHRTGTCIHALAILYMHQKKFKDAEVLIRRALDISTSELGTNHPETLKLIQNHIICLGQNGGLRERLPGMPHDYIVIYNKLLRYNNKILASCKLIIVICTVAILLVIKAIFKL